MRAGSSKVVGPVAAAATLAALMLVGGTVHASDASGESAHAARTISLNETGRLHLTSKHGFTLNEEGSASGTIRGRIYLHLRISSTNHVTAEANIYPSSGSLTGYASANYHVSGATASFSGTMSIARGTGGFRNARGSGLGFNGTIERSNDAVTVRLTGRMSV